MRFLAAALLATAIFSAPCLAQNPKAAPVIPYTPSLDPSSMDRTVDPCVDFYEYSCGGWRKNNPIPSDQARWDVYSKLYQDNLNYLRSILEKAATATNRDAVTQEIGDFYAACMNEAEVEQLGAKPLAPSMDAIAGLHDKKDLAQLVAKLQLAGVDVFFFPYPQQDPDDSNAVIMTLYQGGLGLPDRDYYVTEDAKSKETRDRYVQHVQKMFDLLGDAPDAAAKNAATVMRIETRLAKASLTRVEMRDPYKLKHKMSPADLNKLSPGFDWNAFFASLSAPPLTTINVTWPDYFADLNAQIDSTPIDDLKTYLRFHVAAAAAPDLSSAFVNENFAFNSAYLRGVKEIQPRWKRCVQYTDNDLGEALGQVYVRETFPPETKAATLEMTRRIEDAMALRISQLDWMSAQTKQQAIEKLHKIRNKIGYPDVWRDYSSVKIVPTDFFGDDERASEFEIRRRINKIGKPVDRGEWGMTPPTVDAYFNPAMNDINFPAGVLQPPLYDPKMDAAPNYGNTGSTIGHELTHGFDDQGRQYDANGNLKDWWTKQDAEQFVKRADCVVDQYSQYTVVDDVKLNGKLTEGENVADLGGTILAYIAWKDATKEMTLEERDGLSPDQRFFIGMAQWACANTRPEDLRASVITDPHSPEKYRVNGVVVNMPEFGQAFACKAGQPMVKPADKVCKVW
jgi:endothelin-converting enzyme/putative endopeptidase